MAGKTNPVGKETLERFNATAAPAYPDPVYVNLLTAGPSTDGTVGTYPTDYEEWGMAREPVYSSGSSSTPKWTAAEQDPVAPTRVRIKNNEAVSWGEIAGVGTNVEVTHIGVFTTSGTATGDLLYWDELDVNRTVNDGDTFEFGVGKLRVRED